MKSRTIETLLKNSTLIGEGLFGKAYLLEDKKTVAKVMSDSLPDEPWQEPERAARVLNEVNDDKDFAKAETLDDGTKVLLSKYINGKSIIGNTALFFVNTKNRLLIDYNSEGNVRQDRNGRLWLIDSDLAICHPLKRSLSFASNKLISSKTYNKPIKHLTKLTKNK